MGSQLEHGVPGSGGPAPTSREGELALEREELKRANDLSQSPP